MDYNQRSTHLASGCHTLRPFRLRLDLALISNVSTLLLPGGLSRATGDSDCLYIVRLDILIETWKGYVPGIGGAGRRPVHVAESPEGKAGLGFFALACGECSFIM
jgi:hypothetical protein